MNATIDGERTTAAGDTRIGIRVIDNAGGEHGIEMDREGTIHVHQCEAYADDPAERTPEENEHNNQARRYARYVVHTERGYDTLEPYENPNHLAAVTLAVHAMSDEEIETHFGDFRRQLVSPHDSSVEPVVDPPVDSETHQLTYRVNVYLEEDVADISVAFLERLEVVLADKAREMGRQTLLERLRAPGSEVLVDAPREYDFDVATIAAVSDIHVLYSGVTTDGEETIPGADPFERPPDARLELWPLGVERFEDMRNMLVIHLLCQLRDCYLCMGIEPPADFRLLGPGLWRCTKKYVQNYDLYERYHVMNEEIDGYEATVR
ncbi:hypothetical protein [Natronobiforma cellulositropha]|uniref:hypothetical protein n=1 Tax=Natronobiforma cellulositropha TaxID=1679076 RepID=UPI0021D5755A|nr:hypothetical protein [Natronobiforma cellulositropha]